MPLPVPCNRAMAAAPIFRCRDIHRAERFYRDVLGATANWAWGEGNPGYRSITVFGAEVHLSSFAGDGAFGTAMYIRIDDVDAIAARIGSLAPDCIEHGPEDQPWGQRELYLRDPDNNQIRLGQTLRKGPGA
jgi:catechol 2,3-dioxygenase-like lactoylglutathione lyase family enzyme